MTEAFRALIEINVLKSLAGMFAGHLGFFSPHSISTLFIYLLSTGYILNGLLPKELSKKVVFYIFPLLPSPNITTFMAFAIKNENLKEDSSIHINISFSPQLPTNLSVTVSHKKR